MWIGSVVPASQHVGQSLDSDRGFGEPRGCGRERLAMVVHLAVVVEHDQPLGEVAGQHEFDGVVEEVDARRDDHRLGLGGDRPQLGDRCAGLKGYRHRPEAQQRHVDGRVVDAGEAENRDAVTGPHRILRQRGGDSVDPVRQLAVGDGVETGEQFRGCPARGGVGDELNGALAERRPVGVAVDDGLHDLRQPQLGRFNRVRDCLARPGVGELLVCGVQVGDAAREPLLHGYQSTSRILSKSQEVSARRCA